MYKLSEAITKEDLIGMSFRKSFEHEEIYDIGNVFNLIRVDYNTKEVMFMMHSEREHFEEIFSMLIKFLEEKIIYKV